MKIGLKNGKNITVVVSVVPKKKGMDGERIQEEIRWYTEMP